MGVRAGTIDRYAAIDVRTGKVMTSVSPTHMILDFLRLMKKVVAAYPDTKVHVVLMLPRARQVMLKNGLPSRTETLSFTSLRRVRHG